MNDQMRQELDWRLRVFDSLSYPTLILRPDRTVVAANAQFLERTGSGHDDIVNRSCRRVFQRLWDDPDPPCGERDCPLAKTLTTGTGHSVLRRLEDEAGRERWEDRVFSPILSEDGTIQYVIESIRDVTRVERLERMYHGVQKLMNRVIQSSASGIISANRSGRLLLMNEAAEELFGYDFNSYSTLNIRDLYPATVAQAIMSNLRDEGHGGRGKLPPFRVEILNAKGETVPVEMTAAIIYENDVEIATMGIYNDLRPKLEVEGRLADAQAQVMQSEKLASLGKLAAGVAHEINNPLTGILLYGSLMQEDLPTESPLHENLQCVLEDATRCQEIVKGLLAYSRQTQSSREVFSLNDLTLESLALIRDQKLFMQVEVIKELSTAELLVIGDRKQLSQVVINLVINALDAMEHRGTLTLRTYHCVTNDRICLEVSDTGCGIPPENQSHIFDPFFTTKEPGQGTGLGLSTSYGIVKENGGGIVLSKSDAQGTTFLVSLPAADEPPEDNPESIG